jgi:hypothetical protein
MSTSISPSQIADTGLISDRYTAVDQEFKEAVQYGIERAAEAADLVTVDGEIDVDEIVERAYQEIKTKQVVNIEPGNDDRFSPKKSSTKEELATAVFTAGPTAADAEKNAVERKVYDRCLGLVWNHTVMTGRGRIQQRLDADKLLLVRGRVYRSGNTIDSGVFVTKNPEIVLREYLGPRLENLRKVAAALESDFGLALERDKSLEGPMQAAIESAVTQAVANLPVKQLGSGAPKGTKALGE